MFSSPKVKGEEGVWFLREAYKGALSREEMTELEEMAREKSVGLSLLVERDNEIRGIQNGTILASKVRLSR